MTIIATDHDDVIPKPPQTITVKDYAFFYAAQTQSGFSSNVITTHEAEDGGQDLVDVKAGVFFFRFGNGTQVVVQATYLWMEIAKRQIEVTPAAAPATSANVLQMVPRGADPDDDLYGPLQP
jgi:hypothetical protein